MCIGILFLLAAGISDIGGFSLKAIAYIHAPLVHVVVETSDPEALAEDFSNRGFDVAGWDTKASTIDLILNQDELWMLEHEISLSGTVTDTTSNTPLEGVRVSLTNANFTTGKHFQTGSMGDYALFLPDGTYTVHFYKSGFMSEEKTVTVQTGTPTVLNTQLNQHTFTQYMLAVNTSGSGIGSVGLDPPGGIYDPGTSVTLTAIPDSESIFEGLSGDLTGTTTPQTLIMDKDKNVTATFVMD